MSGFSVEILEGKIAAGGNTPQVAKKKVAQLKQEVEEQPSEEESEEESEDEEEEEEDYYDSADLRKLSKEDLLAVVKDSPELGLNVSDLEGLAKGSIIKEITDAQESEPEEEEEE